MQRRSRAMWVVLLALVAGTLFQVGGSCFSLSGTGLLAALDPCAVLDCSGGILAGAFNPCGDPASTLDDIFVRCP